FFAVLSDPHEFEHVTAEASIGNEIFVVTEKVVKKLGWKELQAKGSQQQADAQQIGKLSEGDRFTNVKLVQTRGETKPPSRFTEGTLLQAMENPVRYMEEDEKHLSKTIQQSGGLGTVATRADIIDKLFSSMSMEMKGKHILIIGKGRQLLDLVLEGLRSHALMAEWELKLSLIA